MLTEDNKQYLERRARESLMAAEKAADSNIAKVHHEFARFYREAAARAAGA